MKTTIGGDRIGSGNKQEVSMRNYDRSSHDLGNLWRSSMSAGTLVPFMNLVALPGDSFDIDLACEVLTLPTIGPLFGSFKVQLDVFQVPIRLYNASLHMNKLGIGMDMSSVYLPLLYVEAYKEFGNFDDAQVNSSALIKYLGISGIGAIQNDGFARRAFNGVPYLGYWDIYKNYYANKQEERGFCIHIDDNSLLSRMAVKEARLFNVANDVDLGSCFNFNVQVTDVSLRLEIFYGSNALEPDAGKVQVIHDAGAAEDISTYLQSSFWDNDNKILTIVLNPETGTHQWQIPTQNTAWLEFTGAYSPSIKEFPLSNIDLMREKILQAPTSSPFIIHSVDLDPYEHIQGFITIDGQKWPSIKFSQENLALKTYQSDLFNNWISTEWIDGANGINEVTKVDTTGNAFTIDSLNLAQKVYNMLNRIAISGGTYDDWLDAVYTHERARSVESPVYMGSLIKELAFDAVVSNADVLGASEEYAPLGTLAGRGKLTGKHKGGKIKVKVDEPSYIMGLVSLTPRVDYSQGNKWDIHLKTMNDFHKPALDAIGYQDLITEQMVWSDTRVTYESTGGSTSEVLQSAGKQPAWINYMTAVNETYGNFADFNKEMFMTLNRRYDVDPSTGAIEDLTTYIDPTKFNQIFAQTNIDAQNFWVQISKNITARRKMSAKVIPNL